MTNWRKCIAAGLCYVLSVSSVWAQQALIAPGIEPVRPSAPVLWRPYSAAQVPPIRLANSGRLRDLVRAGRLYLTVQDAIAIALENNIDLEVARYGPFASLWQVERAEAGGALPGVPSGASQAGSVASGQGVLGSQAAAGVSSTGGATGRLVRATRPYPRLARSRRIWIRPSRKRPRSVTLQLRNRIGSKVLPPS